MPDSRYDHPKALQDLLQFTLSNYLGEGIPASVSMYMVITMDQNERTPGGISFDLG